MIDLYLKFTNKAQAESILYRMEGVVVADPEMGVKSSDGYQVANYANIDVLGVIYERQDIVDPENPPAPIALDGWHVNVRVVDGEDSTPLQPYSVVPTNPRRVWG